ncbi:MAG: type 1 glutamine amidotransferase [Opitutaceae bacterium]
MKLLCIKHIGFEGPGAIAQWAHKCGHQLDIVLINEEHPLPPLENYDAFVFMGGPMNVYEDEQYPWLAKEKAYIRSLIESEKHVLGICLGAQLIACAMGAKVSSGADKEIGWFPIDRADECPAALPLPESLTVYHWHGDAFSIPTGAQRIAESEGCPTQGFSYRGKVLALQCHLEMTPESLALLAAACADELVDGPYIQSADRMQSEPAATFEKMHGALFNLLDAWIEG